MSVAVSSAWCLLVKASLCLEAAERPQWPRLYSLGRPRSCDRMPSLVGERGLELWVPGWALTRMHNISLLLRWSGQEAEEWLCVEQSRELFSNIRGRGGASNACFHSWISPSRRQAAILGHEYINKLLKPFFKIRQSKIALNQTLTLKN